MTATELEQLRRCIELCDRIRQQVDQLTSFFREDH